MLRKILMSAAILGCAACGVTEDEFREGLPSREMVEVKTPAGAGQALEVEAHASVQAVQGERSDFYTLTRVATLAVNGGTLWVLHLLERITAHPATSISGDTATWGPHSDALSPNAWKLTVTKTGEHSYAYTFYGKGKAEPESAFRKILVGTHTAATDPDGKPLKRYGSGAFVLDWNEASTLPEHDGNVGTVEVSYARMSATATASIDAKFRQVKDDQNAGHRLDADYGYRSTPGQGGEFDFAAGRNIDSGASGSALERLTIKSRWTAEGAGRADATATGGDLTTTAYVSECWDASFDSQYFSASYAPSQGYGNEATDCAFSAAVYSSL